MESAKAFAAFKTHIELGSERSLAIAGARLGKSKRMMEKMLRKAENQAAPASPSCGNGK